MFPLQCTTFVKEFGPEIIQLVDQELVPEQICKVYILSIPFHGSDEMSNYSNTHIRDYLKYIAIV